MTSSILATVTFSGSYSTCTDLVGIFTLTVCTPSILLTAPSMACWQCSHEMSGATRVFDSIIVSFLSWSSGCSIPLLISGNRVELKQFLNHFFFTVAFDPSGHTGAEMSL